MTTHEPDTVFPSTTRWTAQGAMSIGGCDLEQVAQQWGTPAYLIDEADLLARARSFRDEFTRAFDAIGPEADVYYAGKAFLCTAMVRLLRDEGLRLDVCTGGELEVAKRGGMPGERIGLHGNNKSPAEIDAALEYGVGRIVLDSLDEIDLVAQAARRHGVVAPVMIRVKTGVQAHTHEYIATAHEDQKFGLSLAGGEVAEAVARVLARSDCLHLLGLHSHIGSQIFDVDGFRVAAQRLVRAQADVAAGRGVTLPELDLGGGFGIAYLPGEEPLAPARLATELAGIVQHVCRDARVAVPRVSVEPGRSIIGPAGVTLYRVGVVKPVQVDDDLVRTYVAVDGGMSDNARPVLYDADYACRMAARAGAQQQVTARVVGKHCESGDIVVRDTRLPQDIRRGDLLAVAATGAYCRALSSQYNHTPRPPVLAVRDGQVRVWLRRETIDDLFALEGD